jgi:hypothetical protein
VSKNQQKTTFNDSSGLLNSWEGTSSAQSQQAEETAANAGTAATGAYGTLMGLGSTGGYDSNLAPLEAQEQQNLQGIDPTQLAGLQSNYNNLISTGGISDATAAAMQRQATSGVGGIYQTLANNLNATRAATGGEGGGGQTAQMARQLSQAQSNATTNVNAQIGQLRQQGTESGLSGLSNLQAAQSAAQNQAANIFSGTQSGVAGNKLAATAGAASGLGGLYSTDVGQSLGQQGLQLQGNQGYLALMANIANKQPNIWQSIMQATDAISGVAGTVGGAITGAGGGVGGALSGAAG